MLGILLFLDSIGGGELLLIMVVILIFFGSEKIPNVARGLGRATREFKDAMNGVQREIEQSMNAPAEEKKVAEKPSDPPKEENNNS